MCEALNGIEIKPGETLPMNDLVGEGTAEKGFKEAGAILDGEKIVDELVCKDIWGAACRLAGDK